MRDFVRSRAGVAVLALTAIGAALRFATIGQQSFWYDEAVTATIVDGSLLDVFRGIVDTESSPPLYYLLAWAWAQLAGTDEAQLRSFSALVGTLVVPVAFVAGRVVGSSRIGLAAAGIAAVSPLLIWYSQEARAYSLLTLLAGASFVLFAVARSAPTSKHLAAWVAVSALAIATHYFAGFVVAAEAVLLLAAHSRVRRAWWSVLAVTLAGIALLPLAVVQASRRRLGWVGGIDLGERVGEMLQRFVTAAPPSSWAGATGAEVMPFAWLGAVAVLTVATALLLTRATGDERRGALLAGQVALVGIGMPIVMAVAADVLTGGDGDYFLDRNVLGAWVPLAVFVASGLAATRAGLFGAVPLVVVIAWSIFVTVHVATSRALQRDDWRAIADVLDERATSVVVYPAYQAAALRWQRPGLVLQRDRKRVERVLLVLVGHEAPPATFREPLGFAAQPVVRTQHFGLLELRATTPTALGPSDVASAPLPEADLELLWSPES